MTEHEIKAADAIIKDGSMYGVTILQIFAQNLKTVPDIDYIIHAAVVLEMNGHITIDKIDEQEVYKLTVAGIELQRRGNSYSDYLRSEVEKQAKQTKKEELDDKIKRLQQQELQQKVEEINPGQLQFWKDLGKRHWQVILLGMGTIIVAILKALGIF